LLERSCKLVHALKAMYGKT